MLDDVLYYACDIGGLQYLNICGAVSKSGIESIDRMKSLKSLTFDKCEVSPADIASMHSLGRLDAIRMQNTPRSREIIPALLKQPLQANWIEFIHCGLGNADLASIAKLKTVRYLNIEANVKITDQGLSHLASMPQLAGLTARGCTITAKSLPIFARMRNLNNLSISLDKWSHADRERLIEVLPKSCIFK